MERGPNIEVYEIDNISGNEGCLVSLIKYVTLFVSGFILLWIITIRAFGAFRIEYAGFFSFMISMGITGYFVYRILNRSDEVYKLIFNDKEQELTIVSGNTFDGVDTQLKIEYNSLYIVIEKKPLINSKVQLNRNTRFREDELSQNRIVKLYDSNMLMREINIDLSDWCRHEKINTILSKLMEISQGHEKNDFAHQ